MGSLGARGAAFAAIAGIVALMTFAFASPAPGSATAVAELSVLPGLEATTYGQTAAYSALPGRDRLA